MDLTSVKTIKNLLLKYHAHPSKKMGQNFLIDKSTLNKIIETAQLTPKDTILEIGPGIGTLTKELAENMPVLPLKAGQAGSGKIIAIEKDKIMCEILKETLKEYKNVEIIQGNALLTTNYKLPTYYKIVANIPYYITSPIIRKFLEAENPPGEMILMVQKEVAQRICAKPPNMSLLAVSVQCYAKAEIISYVSKQCFWPAPKVDSAIIKITPFKRASGGPTPAGSADSSADFFTIVKAGFSHPRKQLVNNLSTLKSLNGVTLDKYKVIEWLSKNNINPNQRAETLSVENWIALTASFQ